MSFPNEWHHRQVAASAAKPCDICYRASSSVLITPDKSDFFYVCPNHLKDTHFCTPIIDHEAIAARKKKEMDEELENLKKEYEEKQRKKKEKEKHKEDDKKGSKKDDEKTKEKIKDSGSDDEKKDESKSTPEASTPKEDEPRIFALQKTFYQQRIHKRQQAEIAKRNRERLSNPNFFPSVPKGSP